MMLRSEQTAAKQHVHVIAAAAQPLRPASRELPPERLPPAAAPPSLHAPA